MAEELDYILNKEKMDVDHLRLLKIKQSVEAIFFVLVFFSMMMTIGEIMLKKGQEGIEVIQKANVETESAVIPFDYSVKVSDVNKVVAAEIKVKIVKVKKGQNIYTIMKANKIPYSDENIDKVRKLNPQIKSIRKLQIGDEVNIPIREEK